MVCFEATLDTCIDQYRDIVGSDMINGRTLKEAMSVVAKGMISGSLRPYQIIRLQSPRCADLHVVTPPHPSPACSAPATERHLYAHDSE